MRREQGDGRKAETKMVKTSEKAAGNNGASSSTKPKLGGGGSRSQVPSIEDRRNKPYSFRKDKVIKIFQDAMQNGLKLADSKRPEEANRSDEPNFCPYHRLLGHTIENCWVFKDWVERKYQAGEITLSKGVLQDPAPHEQSNVVCTVDDNGSPPNDVEDPCQEPWIIHLARRTRRLLRKLKETPGIKWKNEITPIVPKAPKPVEYMGGKFKRKIKNKKSKKKSTEMPKLSALQVYINSLEEYEQGHPIPSTLEDFIPEEVKKVILGLESEENSETKQETHEGAQEEESNENHVETCCHITIIDNEEAENEEGCLAIHFGSDSEEDLCRMKKWSRQKNRRSQKVNA
jgi:hypothetical protein